MNDAEMSQQSSAGVQSGGVTNFRFVSFPLIFNKIWFRGVFYVSDLQTLTSLCFMLYLNHSRSSWHLQMWLLRGYFHLCPLFLRFLFCVRFLFVSHEPHTEGCLFLSHKFLDFSVKRCRLKAEKADQFAGCCSPPGYFKLMQTAFRCLAKNTGAH